jgi:hypothetical protein
VSAKLLAQEAAIAVAHGLKVASVNISKKEVYLIMACIPCALH